MTKLTLDSFAVFLSHGSHDDEHLSCFALNKANAGSAEERLLLAPTIVYIAQCMRRHLLLLTVLQTAAQWLPDAKHSQPPTYTISLSFSKTVWSFIADVCVCFCMRIVQPIIMQSRGTGGDAAACSLPVRHSLIHLCLHSFIDSYLHSFIHSFIHSTTALHGQ